jgi:hypothetical protein
LEQADDDVAVLEDEPVLRDVAAEGREAELLIEVLRGVDVLDGEADGEVAELHGGTPGRDEGSVVNEARYCLAATRSLRSGARGISRVGRRRSDFLS